MNRHHSEFTEPAINWEDRIITISDYNRILDHIRNDIGNINVLPDVLHHLYLLLYYSKKFLSESVPENVITMNSKFELVSGKNKPQTYRIVFPEDVTESGNISVYTSLGVACLGSTVNSYISYSEEDKHINAHIARLVFQPEKEKLYYL
ncbi:MAG: GreA/GreB family elongation factor [Bacteroidales bacterium]|nr:GreA/GreB family elongation factor [Bacteroidales bacterium]